MQPENRTQEMAETAERLQVIGSSILRAARDELYLGMRFLDVALSSFSYQMDGSIHGFGTDGRVMYFQPQMLGGLYKENRILVNRGYLHMVFHCIFRHFAWRGAGRNIGAGYSAGENNADSEKTIEERLRDLSCDIAVEHIIDGMNYRSIRFSRSLLRRETYRLLEKEGKTLNAQRVYKILSGWNLSEKDFVNLEQEFRTDDHKYWESKKPDQKPNPMLSRKWGEINDGIETDLETFSQEAGEHDGDFLEQIKTENRSKYDYREFLRKFAVFHEEMAVDNDSFDYNFYTYGLRLYGNMPLIEPLESKEVKKVEEFVIVIDTSMSCSGELVRKFLEETYGVLSENESFFIKINVHIIQCDEKVHTDKKITSQEEMKDYMEHLELYGDGGTDFRPAFEWVDRLLEQHEFHNLKGLIYFTDGFGIYPQKMPPYKTAFVFMQDNYRDVDVPVWAMKLILDEDDLTESGK
ncbi:VWA-like domain-containing protein [Blautia luti]|uniref:Metallopeptidase n=1 Tax=Blautia luti DSM 14534 = JCM 17040 TaxID=649762 RepID=A0A844GJV7_9FIRM|nr:VWA-like domain-containing protein [Blautia luti]MTD61599.1 metallopeptidase [Blautia luti DSM 14534 = JCM 17040]BEI59322.1 VWA-like domain-containing protein [Blautia luti]